MVMTPARPTWAMPQLGARVSDACWHWLRHKSASQRRDTRMTSNEWARAWVFFLLGLRVRLFISPLLAFFRNRNDRTWTLTRM
jgi:hypothetical protein